MIKWEIKILLDKVNLKPPKLAKIVFNNKSTIKYITPAYQNLEVKLFSTQISQHYYEFLVTLKCIKNINYHTLNKSTLLQPQSKLLVGKQNLSSMLHIYISLFIISSGK